MQRTFCIHYKEHNFEHRIRTAFDKWDNYTFLDLIKVIEQKYAFQDPFMLYEKIENEHFIIDDIDDLKAVFDDTQTPNIYIKDADEIERDNWMKGSYLLVYSRSKKQWFKGQIIAIIGKYHNEWLVIKYNQENMTKQVQRNAQSIKAYKSDNILSLRVGSKCLILSDYSAKSWYEGEVISICNDAEGEWLKVKYTENMIEKEVDIQRYSPQITTFNAANYNKLIVESKQNEEEKQEIRIKALYENYDFEWTQVKDLLGIFANILKNPYNARYRSINVNKIKHKYQANPLCVELLFDSGFKKSKNGKQIVFDIKDIKKLNKTNKALMKQFDEMAKIVWSAKISFCKMNSMRAQKICKAIADYYESMKECENYKNTFSEWFKQESFDEHEIDNVIVCCYLQFDEHRLPLPQSIKRFKDEVRFEIIRYCFKWNMPPPFDQIKQFYHKIEDRQEAYEFMQNMPSFDEILGSFDKI